MLSAWETRVNGGLSASPDASATGLGETTGMQVGDGPTVELELDGLWEQVFLIAPLVLVATREGDGWDVAPKHMAGPLGWDPYYAFVCSPRHATYRNAVAHGAFTVSFPPPELLVATGLAAGGRDEEGRKPSLAALPTVAARSVDGVVVAGCPLQLECELDRTVDGFGENSLVVGRVVAAHAYEDALRGPDVDDADLVNDLGLLAYLQPGRLAVVRDSVAFPYPSDFRL